MLNFICHPKSITAGEFNRYHKEVSDNLYTYRGIMQESFGNYTVEVGTIDGTSMSLVVLSSEASVQQSQQDMNLISSILKSSPKKSNEEKKLLADLESQMALGKSSQAKGKVLNIILFSQVRVDIEERQADLFYENLCNFASQITSKAYLGLRQNEQTEPQSIWMKVLDFLAKPVPLISKPLISKHERIYLGNLLGKAGGNMTSVTVIHPLKEGVTLSVEIDEYQFPSNIFNKMLEKVHPARKEEG